MSNSSSYNYGKQAFINEVKRAPAADSAFMKEHMTSKVVGEATQELKDWLAGYDDAHDEAMRIEFPEFYPEVSK